MGNKIQPYCKVKVNVLHNTSPGIETSKHYLLKWTAICVVYEGTCSYMNDVWK